jgi:hypothetical protein
MPYEISKFIKIPVVVSDSTTDYYLFDIMLPAILNEKTNLMILSFLCKIRPLLSLQKNVDGIVSSFLDSQPYVMFNYMYISEEDNQQNRVSTDGLKKIKFGEKTFSLNNQEQSDFYFHSMMCMFIMTLYNTH